MMQIVTFYVIMLPYMTRDFIDVIKVSNQLNLGYGDYLDGLDVIT